MVAAQQAIADTSVLVGLEAGRVAPDRFAEYAWAVSAISLGALRLGVLRATDPETSSIRLATYQLARQFDPLVVDEAVADAWAVLIARLRADGRRMPVNDTWIAATAVVHGAEVWTQDDDFTAFQGLDIVRV